MSNNIIEKAIINKFNRTENNSKIDSETLQEYSVDSILTDEKNRTLWINGMPFGNAYIHFNGNSVSSTQPTHAEIFNDFDNNIASGNYSHAEGKDTTASGDYSHAEGYETTASGDYSHTEGRSSIAGGRDSHAEGYKSEAHGNGSHAEGGYYIDSSNNAVGGIASGIASHAEGCGTMATGTRSHAEGNGTIAEGPDSHAEGSGTTAGGDCAHAEGISTKASGVYSHAEGYGAEAHGIASHAEGGGWDSTQQKYLKGGIAKGNGSHAEGICTIATNAAEHASGKYNVSTKDSTIFSVGIGTSEERRNAIEITNTGDIYIGADSDNNNPCGYPNGGNTTLQSLIANQNLEEITYSDLVEKRDDKNLIPGKFYRITDYITTTTKENTASAGYRFDIIVLALSKNTLSEDAWAVQHDFGKPDEIIPEENPDIVITNINKTINILNFKTKKTLFTSVLNPMLNTFMVAPNKINIVDNINYLVEINKLEKGFKIYGKLNNNTIDFVKHQEDDIFDIQNYDGSVIAGNNCIFNVAYNATNTYPIIRLKEKNTSNYTEYIITSIFTTNTGNIIYKTSSSGQDSNSTFIQDGVVYLLKRNGALNPPAEYLLFPRRINMNNSSLTINSVDCLIGYDIDNITTPVVLNYSNEDAQTLFIKEFIPINCNINYNDLFNADGTIISRPSTDNTPVNDETYFKNSNLGAWQLRYCLDNERFDWGDVNSGKGIIYRMIDEFGNDCPYDFKNILYKLPTPQDHSKYKLYYTFTGGYDASNKPQFIPSNTDGDSYDWSLSGEVKRNQILTNLNDLPTVILRSYVGQNDSPYSYCRGNKIVNCSLIYLDQSYENTIYDKHGEYYSNLITFAGYHNYFIFNGNILANNVYQSNQ